MAARKRIKWFLCLLWRQADAWEKGKINISTAWAVGRILKDL